MCSICEKEGHLKNNCPEEKLPPLLPLPAMTEESLKLLNEMLMQIPSKPLLLLCSLLVVALPQIGSD